MAAMTTETNGNTAQPKENGAKKKGGGLEGIVAATTGLSKVEGTAGRLFYRGYNIHDLAKSATYEEIAYLLWYGNLPNRAQLDELKARMAAERSLPSAVLASLRALPAGVDPMDALRTAVSAWGAGNIKGKPTIEQVIALVARMPVFLAAFQRLRMGLEPLESRPELGHAANYLYLLTGEVPSENHVKTLDAYLVMLADHGMNASTFTARIVVSTESDLASAIVAAIGALKGPLHGGAPSKVQDMLVAIGEPEKAETWMREALARGERLMGFGHRVYRTLDPRAEELRELARQNEPEAFALASHVEETGLAILKEHRPERALYTNVEFYSAVVMSAVGLPGDLFTPTFAVSRSAGWTAHVLEQVGNNRLIRPEAEYTGALDLPFVPLNSR